MEQRIARRSPHAYDDETLLAIGRLTTQVGLLDFNAHTVVWQLLDDPGTGRAVTEKLSTWEIGDLLKRLAERSMRTDVDADLRAKLREIGSDLAGIAGRRNEVIHGLWVVSEGRDVSARLRDFIRDSESLLEPPTDVDAVNGLIREVLALIERCRSAATDVIHLNAARRKK